MLEKVFLIRADGNKNIGMGHIMRCLSIADAAKKHGWQCIFIVADEDCVTTIDERNYLTVVLHSEYRYLDDEIGLVEKQIQRLKCNWFLVDSYFASFSYLSAIRSCLQKQGGKLICMDGNATFPYPCDVFINYNIYGTTKKDELIARYKCNRLELPAFLLGPKYVPLRSTFRDLPDRKVNIISKHVLISTGGTDSEHIALNIVKKIKGLQTTLKFHIILGIFNPDQIIIRQVTSNCKNIILYQNVTNMSEIMQHMDVAISAAGSTLYELCATQTPTVTYVMANNQIPGAIAFYQAGLMRFAGDSRKKRQENFVTTLLAEAMNLAGDYEERKKMAASMKKVVSRHGADNIIKALLAIKGYSGTGN